MSAFFSYPTVWSRARDGRVQFVRAGEQWPAMTANERDQWTVRRATKAEELRASAEGVIDHIGEHYDELVYLIKQDQSLRTFVRDALARQVSNFLIETRSNEDGTSES